MGLGAIVVVEAGYEGLYPADAQERGRARLLNEPLACVNVFGRSMLERSIDYFVRADVEAVKVLVSASESCRLPALLPTSGNASVEIHVVNDLPSAITQTVKGYRQNGIDHAFVASSGVYAEADFLDFFYFHRGARRTITRASDQEGSLDLWVVDCERSRPADLENILAQGERNGAPYVVGGYVRRLSHVRDLRGIVSDALRGRCVMRPSCREVKPGIWIEEGAEVDRRARILAPAYIGYGSTVQEDTLITRCSSIEENCYIDYGTVVEDSSVLANTHIGIWLDVCHAVAKGNTLLSLEHDVALEISDPNVMRSIRPLRTKNNPGFQRQDERPETAADLQPEESPAPDTWQLGTNLIQG